MAYAEIETIEPEVQTQGATPVSNITVAEFDIRQHDCRITIKNGATGDHRSFRIKTVTKGNLAGKRIVSLLVGPDNGNDWQGFGFVNPDGQIRVWNSFQGHGGKRSAHEVFARMLTEIPHFQQKGAEYFIEKRCCRCGRVLSHPQSIKDGIGPECVKKV